MAKWLKWPDATAWRVSTMVGFSINAQLSLRSKKADLPNEFSLGGTKCDDFAFELLLDSVRFLSVGYLWVLSWVEQIHFD